MSGIMLDELVDIGIRDSGGHELDINADGSLNATVTATDFDIRDLTHVSDSIKIGDGTDFLAINADGSINVSFSVPTADDDADAGNPLKTGTRAVDGLLSAVSASNDRADMISDMYRRLWVNDSANVGFKVSAETVGLTAVEIVSTPLAGRRFVTIQNEGSVDVYLGHANTVTTANGIKISKKSSATYELGEDLDLWMISGTAGQDVRVLEAA
jgi:hypothetical protein